MEKITELEETSSEELESGRKERCEGFQKSIILSVKP